MKNDLYHKLMQNILALLLSICVWGSNWPFALAVDYSQEHFSHDEFLKDVIILPGITLPMQAKEKLQMLQYASYLCIDQFNDKRDSKASGDQSKLDWLRKRVHGLPKSINEFNPDSDKKQLSGTNHRSYTHRGWGFPYSKSENDDDDIAKSKLRMKIMQNTVQTVFSFQLKSDSKIIGWAQSLIHREFDNEKMDAFCRLVYYVHILGDCYEAKYYNEATDSKNEDRIPLGRAKHGETIEDTDIISELIALLPKLINQENSPSTFPSMMQDLELMQDKIREFYSRLEGISSDEAYMEYHQLTSELMDILIMYVPDLLSRESFFSNAFYE